MDPIIKLDNVSVAYDLGKGNEMWALKKVSVEIFPQEFVIFFGPSGCGKSTLLNTIAGLEFPTEGSVVVNGRNINKLSEEEQTEFHRKSVGIIFQAYYLLPELSVKGNISLPVLFSGDTVDNDKLNDLMERFGIKNLSSRYLNQLSGGQQQRVAVARSLINNPPIILADEPVGNLDSKNAEAVMSLISDLNKSYKKTIILVTHNPKYLGLAGRVFYMKDGKVTKIVGDDKGAKGTSRDTELDQLSFDFPYLNASQLKAKLILNHLFMPGDFIIQKKIEKVINSYIDDTTTSQELYKFLDEDRTKGGVGFYKQTAEKISEEIKKLSEEMKLFDEEDKNEENVSSSEDKIVSLRKYILDKFPNLKLSIDQIAKIDKILSDRVDEKIKNKDLFVFLNRSVRRGGLGINRRTANKIIREVELIVK